MKPCVNTNTNTNTNSNINVDADINNKSVSQKNNLYSSKKISMSIDEFKEKMKTYNYFDDEYEINNYINHSTK